MRILFVLKQRGYLRHFRSVVARLAEREHAVRLAYQDGEHGVPSPLDRCPGVSATPCASKRADEWSDHASLFRRLRDYLRYQTPPFSEAFKLRARALDKLLHTLSYGRRQPGSLPAEFGLGLTGDELDRLRSLAGLLEAQIPVDESITAFIRHENPDAVLVSPLVEFGSGQTDFVKACHALGVPVAMVLFSWDNLSSKGLIHEVPDRVFVWNDIQVREAVDLHQVPEKRVVVTGAPRFDEFFGLESSLDRASFCEHLGFDPAQPIIVYLGSSKFVAAREEGFIGTWIESLRRHSDLARANILIKIHPDLHAEWDAEGHLMAWEGPGGDVRMRVTTPYAHERVAVVRAPFTAYQGLYECLYHAAAVVGLNTSAEIEAGIVGRPVFTIRAPTEFADGQESSIHFHYLLKERGGFVERASTLDEHRTQVARGVAGDFDREAIRRFIGSFVRPRGLKVPATEYLVQAVERMAKITRKKQATRSGDVRLPASHAAAREGELVDLDYQPIRIRLRVTSDAERQWRAYSCRKEPWTVAWIERVAVVDTVLYDIGANVGTFTLIAARRQPKTTVVAFEPGYASFAHLCENLVLNRCQGNVIPVPLPLWSASGLVGLKYRSREPGQSRHAIRERRPRRAPSARDGRYEQPVLATTLDALVREYDLPLPTAIKLDVDGGELEVLRGAAGVLRSASLTTILIEVADETRPAVEALLTEHGFEGVSVTERSKPGAPAYLEFTRPQRVPRAIRLP
ncbi:MAG: FkbM family methyltransferase [Acidobacteriota bacterium]